MSADFDRALDEGRLYLVDPLTVTLIRPASYSGGGQAARTVQYVHEQPASQDDVDSPLGGSLDGTRRTFHLWRVECEPVIPHNDYQIVMPDGKRWIIKGVEILAHGRRFRVKCLESQTTTD